MPITFGPEAVHALHRTLVAGPAARDWWERTRTTPVTPPVLDLSGSGAQVTRPVPPRVTYTPGTRTTPVGAWVGPDRTLTPRSTGSDRSTLPGAPDGHPEDTYPAQILRDMRTHASAWDEEHRVAAMLELAPIATPPVPIYGSDPRGWWDGIPRTVTSLRARGEHTGDGWTPGDGWSSWSLPEGTSIPADVTPGRTLSGAGWGVKLQQERTRKGTPRFAAASVPADPKSYGGVIPSPWVAPPSYARLSLTLASAWAQAGQVERFTVRDVSRRHKVLDPIARGGVLVTVLDPVLSRLRWGTPLPPVLDLSPRWDGETVEHRTLGPLWSPVAPTGDRWGTVWVTSSRGRVIGHPTRWVRDGWSRVTLDPVSPTVVAQAVAMVAAGLIGSGSGAQVERTAVERGKRGSSTRGDVLIG
jgi:hypothetical protein